MKKLYLISIFLLSFLPVMLFGENSLIVPHTTISRHANTLIPILGNIDATSCTISFEYNAFQINIKDVIGGADYLITDDIINYTKDETQLQNSILTISGTNLNTSADTLFFIEVRALATNDTVFYLTPLELVVNGNSDTNASLMQGELTLPADELPILDIGNADVGLFYPNPFSYMATLEFSVETDTKLNIAIYNTAGRLISNIPTDFDKEEITIYDNSDKRIDTPLSDYIFTEGRYKMTLQPKDENWAQGAYFAIIKLGNQSFILNFLIMN